MSSAREPEIPRPSCDERVLLRPTGLTRVYLRSVARYAAEFALRGWTPATAGNFSVRDGAILYVSRSGIDKGALSVDDFVAARLTDGGAASPSPRRPSDETALHAALYRLNPEARVVLHAHLPATGVAARPPALTLAGDEMLKALGRTDHQDTCRIPVFENTQDIKGLASEITASDLEAGIAALILERHGVYAWGANPRQAFKVMDALEFLGQRALADRQIYAGAASDDA